jgi:hypothetical protein
MLRQIFVRAGELDVFYRLVGEFVTLQRMRQPKLTDKESEMEMEYLSCWSRLAKDTPQGREAVYRLALVCLRSLKHKILRTCDRGLPAEINDDCAAPSFRS